MKIPFCPIWVWLGAAGFLAAVLPAFAATPPLASLAGKWTIDATRSSAIKPWDNQVLLIEQTPDKIVIKRELAWGADRKASDATTVVTDGKTSTANPVGYWLDTWYTNVYSGGDHQKHVTGEWLEAGRVLKLETQLALEAQQGDRAIHIYDEYRLSADGRTLKVFELRSTRDEVLVYVFTRN